MKHIRRHFRRPMYHKGKEILMGVTIVGDAEKQSDGTVLFKFGAARCSIKDNFVKNTGMLLATERYNNYPHSERLLISQWNFNLVLGELATHIAFNPMYIKEHFKS